MTPVVAHSIVSTWPTKLSNSSFKTQNGREALKYTALRDGEEWLRIVSAEKVARENGSCKSKESLL